MLTADVQQQPVCTPPLWQAKVPLQARLEAAGQLKAELARSQGEAESLREQLAAASRALWTSHDMPRGAAMTAAAGAGALSPAPLGNRIPTRGPLR